MTTDTFSHVEGRGVVASDSAESIGSVKGFVLDARGRQIEAIHIDGRGRKAAIINWSAVEAFGADAVMATSGADPSTIDNEHQRLAVKGVVTMLGTRVLQVDGREVGTVTDVEFDTDSGAVVRVQTDQGPIEPDRLRSLGSYALVVDVATSSAG
ncbi:MAG: PRC-barrel domain-containing protein [Ilumatobacteraceae bacterium]